MAAEFLQVGTSIRVLGVEEVHHFFFVRFVVEVKENARADHFDGAFSLQARNRDQFSREFTAGAGAEVVVGEPFVALGAKQFGHLVQAFHVAVIFQDFDEHAVFVSHEHVRGAAVVTGVHDSRKEKVRLNPAYAKTPTGVPSFMFEPFHHAKFLGDAWKGTPPKYNLGSSGFQRELSLSLQQEAGEMNMVAQVETEQTIADFLAMDAACVLPTAGTTGANTAALLAHGGDLVSERPYYAPIPELARGLGRQVHFGEGVVEIKSKITKKTGLVALSSPSNPTGQTYSDKELLELAETAHDVGAFLLVDQVFGALTDSCKANLHPNIISTAGVNKAWGAGALRFGWLATNNEHLESYGDIHRYTALAPSPTGERIGCELLQNAETHRLALETHLANNHAVYNEWLETVPFESPPAASLTAFPKVLRTDTETWCHELLQEGILAVPGEYFGKAGHIRIGLGATGLRESLAALRAICNQ